AQEGCLEAPNGQYPSWMNITPVCDGTTQQIQVVTTGEYSMVDVTAGTQYKFSSSITTDYITISDEAGTEVLAAGTGPVTWTADADRSIRFYLHLDENCNWGPGYRSRIIQCGNIQEPPVNDDCANAIPLSCGDSDQGTTAYAANSGGNVSGDVFYSYTGDGTRKIVNVSLCGSSFDTFVRVFTDCSMTQEVTQNNDFCDTQSFVSFVAEPTSTYYIMVEGYNTAVGDYVINLSCADAPPAPDNDNCSDITPVTLTNGEPMTFTGSTEWATASPNEEAAFGFGT